MPVRFANFGWIWVCGAQAVRATRSLSGHSIGFIDRLAKGTQKLARWATVERKIEWAKRRIRFILTQVGRPARGGRLRIRLRLERIAAERHRRQWRICVRQPGCTGGNEKRKRKNWNTNNFLRKKKKKRSSRATTPSRRWRRAARRATGAFGCRSRSEPWPRAQRTSELQARDAITITIKDKK